jgi:hypothetical protein
LINNSTMFNSFCWQVDIVFIKEDIRTVVWCCHCQPNMNEFTSLILCNSKIHYLWCGSNQRMQISRSTPHSSIPPISNWGIWMSTQKSWCVFTWLCQCHFGAWKSQKAFIFLFWLLFSIKNLNHIAKDANIFHFKLGDSHRPSYFSTSTL